MATRVKTLLDAIRYLSDEQVCIDTEAGIPWLNGTGCPERNAKANRQRWLKTQRRWQCRDCGQQSSVKAGTIFEDSAIGLDKLLNAMWLLANCRNGIRFQEIARSVGITQKSAWFMLHRLREAAHSLQTHAAVRKNNHVFGQSRGPVLN